MSSPAVRFHSPGSRVRAPSHLLTRVLGPSSIAALILLLQSAPARSQVRQALAEAQAELLAEAADDNFGWSVAAAGDVNGDGVGDLVVGAIYNDSAAKDAGKAYVYLGGSVVSTIPFVTMTGMAANDQFGVSVAAAGDVNGDGFADIIVGARLNSMAGPAAGAAFIYFGGRTMSGVPSVVLLGEGANDWFGNSVAGAGDVNGDGYADVIVGAPYNDRGGSAAGAAYVFYGGPVMDAVPDVILVGEIHDDQFGWSVAGAGDVNGDHLSDVIVGARLHCTDQTICPGAAYARGRAYVFEGGRPMDAAPDVVLNGEAANDWFGNTVAGVGDLNGDGLDDVAVGAIYADPVVNGVTLSAAGTASVYFGGSPMDATRDALLTGEQVNGQFGWAIAPAGDVAGDGRRGLWTTAHFYDDGLVTGAGKIYMFAGGAQVSPVPGVTAVGEGQDVQLGQSVAGGDVAGTGGLADVIAGQVYSKDVGSGSGKAFVLSPFCVDLALDPISLSWNACSPFDSFDLYAGDVVTDLRNGSYGICAETGLTTQPASLPPGIPPPGDAFFYLLSGRTSDLEGALGFDSSGVLRPNSYPCP
jgi:FG-GAP repeat